MTANRRKPLDRRVERTRTQLHHALISLMQEKGYEQVTVQDVLERANVGRTTFYAHYKSKEALLDEGFAHLGHELRVRGRVAEGEDQALSFVRPMLEHAHEHKKLYRALVGRRSGALVQQRVRKVMSGIVKAQLTPRARDFDVPVDVLVEYVVGSFLLVMTWWLDHRTGLSPDQMGEMFVRLALPSLEAARRRPVGSRSATRP